MNIRNKLPILTNIVSIIIGYVLSQNNLAYCKIAMVLAFILWIATYSQLEK